MLGKRFIVKGTHQRFYYPWAFPKNIPQTSSVAEQMRNAISFIFGQTYKGFCPETKPYLSDSEATTTSSGNDDDGSDAEEYCFLLDGAMTSMQEVPGVPESTR